MSRPAHLHRPSTRAQAVGIGVASVLLASATGLAQSLETDPRADRPAPPTSYTALRERFLPDLVGGQPTSLLLTAHGTAAMTVPVRDGVCYGAAAFSDTITELALVVRVGDEIVAQGPRRLDAYPTTTWCSTVSGEVEIELLAYEGEGVAMVGLLADPVSEYWAGGSGDELENRMARLIGRSAPHHFPALPLEITAFGREATQRIQVELEPGYCYAVLGVGEPSVFDLDLVLVDPQGRIVDQDFGIEPTAVVSTCPTAAGTYGVRVALIAGSGQVATQLMRISREVTP